MVPTLGGASAEDGGRSYTSSRNVTPATSDGGSRAADASGSTRTTCTTKDIRFSGWDQAATEKGNDKPMPELPLGFPLSLPI